MKSNTIDNSHWESIIGKFDPEDLEGFIYLVTNEDGSKQYIGKKNFHKTRRVIVKGRKNRKIVKSKSDWLSYKSSSEYLKEDIKILGQENFKFYIIDVYKTKGGLYNAECYYQHLLEVLTKKNLGTGDLRFYNRQIAGIKFLPKEPVNKKNKNKLIKLLKEVNKDYDK